MAELQSMPLPEALRSVPPAGRAVDAQPSRHSALVRITHWITVLSFLALLVSGAEILISHPRFYWAKTGTC